MASLPLHPGRTDGSLTFAGPRGSARLRFGPSNRPDTRPADRQDSGALRHHLELHGLPGVVPRGPCGLLVWAPSDDMEAPELREHVQILVRGMELPARMAVDGCHAAEVRRHCVT